MKARLEMRHNLALTGSPLRCTHLVIVPRAPHGAIMRRTTPWGATFHLRKVYFPLSFPPFLSSSSTPLFLHHPMLLLLLSLIHLLFLLSSLASSIWFVVSYLTSLDDCYLWKQSHSFSKTVWFMIYVGVNLVLSIRATQHEAPPQ